MPTLLVWQLLVAAHVFMISTPSVHIHAQAYNYKDYFEAYDDLGLQSSSGLSWNFYQSSCPLFEFVVSNAVNTLLDADITQAAGLLRLHFHDCFVLGCDASVLLVGEGSEQTALPNLSLRPESFRVINNIKQELEEICPNIVSCADIVALAARDSVSRAMGPRYPVLLGRRDSLVFGNVSVVLASLPPPSFNVSQLLASFNAVGLDATDLVSLSGAFVSPKGITRNS